MKLAIIKNTTWKKILIKTIQLTKSALSSAQDNHSFCWAMFMDFLAVNILEKDHLLVSSPIRMSKRSTGMSKSNGSGGDRIKTLSCFTRILFFFLRKVSCNLCFCNRFHPDFFRITCPFPISIHTRIPENRNG